MNILRKIIPKPILRAYHFVLAGLAAFLYGHSSKKLTVIGVTGTTGKTTTCNLIYQILQKSGKKCAMMSTSNFAIGDKEWISKYKQTMLGRFKTQKFLKEAVKEGCKFCIIEVTSQGIEQYRHKGIDFDCGVFTNLFSEHVEAHGGFENYKKAKLKFFKVVKNKIVANADSKYAPEFLDFLVREKLTFGIKNENCNFRAVNIKTEGLQVKFQILNPKCQMNSKCEVSNINNDIDFSLNMLGEYNVYNALSAIAVCSLYKMKLEDCANILKKVKLHLGKMEFIEEGQDFKVIVDYAFEPNALENVYQAVTKLLSFLGTRGRIISVLGSTGGGRDVARRPKLGALAAKYADIVIVTNEDPYDDDPKTIIDDVVAGVLNHSNSFSNKSNTFSNAKPKRLNENLFKILNRRDAIALAIKKAQKGDVVLITGKGCEQMIMTGPVGSGKGIAWDDRVVVREELEKILSR
jgi:UDP-N-acetylmuramoyl-L-alanyl-D-glutamate--2,6-diaminopimelate ligase